MANIKIQDLHSPSYLDDLKANELMVIGGRAADTWHVFYDKYGRIVKTIYEVNDRPLSIEEHKPPTQQTILIEAN
ncbi:MAG: hypothetical protein F6K35_33350 [Okeania sp. SIO2H7]|nr:hypothetical protein [Okeania sp. SIO2H7]